MRTDTHAAQAAPVRRCETTIPKRLACPCCGDEKHLYARADVRWEPDMQEWTIAYTESELDCTQCDWTGIASELLSDPATIAGLQANRQVT